MAVADHLGFLSPADVTNQRSFALYVQQRTGTPLESNYALLGRQIKNLREQYPQANWFTLCRIVDWAVAKRKRFAHPYQLVAAYRYAWADGFLPELGPRDPVDEVLEQRIDDVLCSEQDPEWRSRFLRARGPGRKQVFEEWVTVHQGL